MTAHLLLPGVDLRTIHLLPAHEEWLGSWLQNIESHIEDGIISSSMCLMGVMGELALYRKVRTDWLGVLDAYLTVGGKPVAYSEGFGKKLYKFTAWLQTPVHAIHARWWIERECYSSATFDYRDLITGLIQPNGWIYDDASSQTRLQTRMKSEYMMSCAMGLEILQGCGALDEHKESFKATLADEALSGYVSAEYFRLRALAILTAPHLAPVGRCDVLGKTQAGHGYNDFDLSGKVDDYMGTAKRKTREEAIHSPLVSLYAAYVASTCGDEIEGVVDERLTDFGRYLLVEPLGVEAFKIRDLDVDFGTELTPLEILAASSIALRSPIS